LQRFQFRFAPQNFFVVHVVDQRIDALHHAVKRMFEKRDFIAQRRRGGQIRVFGGDAPHLPGQPFDRTRDGKRHGQRGDDAENDDDDGQDDLAFAVLIDVGRKRDARRFQIKHPVQHGHLAGGSNDAGLGRVLPGRADDAGFRGRRENDRALRIGQIKGKLIGQVRHLIRQEAMVDFYHHNGDRAAFGVHDDFRTVDRLPVGVQLDPFQLLVQVVDPEVRGIENVRNLPGRRRNEKVAVVEVKIDRFHVRVQRYELVHLSGEIAEGGVPFLGVFFIVVAEQFRQIHVENRALDRRVQFIEALPYFQAGQVADMVHVRFGAFIEAGAGHKVGSGVETSDQQCDQDAVQQHQFFVKRQIFPAKPLPHVPGPLSKRGMFRRKRHVCGSTSVSDTNCINMPLLCRFRRLIVQAVRSQYTSRR